MGVFVLVYWFTNFWVSVAITGICAWMFRPSAYERSLRELFDLLKTVAGALVGPAWFVITIVVTGLTGSPIVFFIFLALGCYLLWFLFHRNEKN